MKYIKSSKFILAVLIYTCSVNYLFADNQITYDSINKDLVSKIKNIQKDLKAAENQEKWPKGYCSTLYKNLNNQANGIFLSAKKYNKPVIQYNAKQLSEQSLAMLDQCDNFEKNIFKGGQLQNRYLRADMSLWNVQFNNLLKNPDYDIKKIAINSITQAKDTSSLKAHDIFNDCNENICPKLTIIPAGKFLMGGTEEEHKELNVDSYRADWESPRHQVNIRKPFAIATTEITVGQFAQFVKETNRPIAEGCLGFPGFPTMSNPNYAIFQKDFSWKNPGFKQTENSPAVCVTRADAEDYAYWLSKKTGATYRLPSESEWEYSARAGTQTAYFWGRRVEDGCAYATYYDKTTDKVTGFKFKVANCDDKTPYTATVGSFKPNPWGLYDMTGNAREWVSDAWENSYATGPKDERPRTKGVSQFPVLRGGGWNYMPQNVRIAYRSAYYAWPMRSNMWGFRLVREL